MVPLLAGPKSVKRASYPAAYGKVPGYEGETPEEQQDGTMWGSALQKRKGKTAGRQPRVTGQMEQEPLCCLGYPAPHMLPGTSQDSPFINVPVGSSYHTSPSSCHLLILSHPSAFCPLRVLLFLLPSREGAASFSSALPLTRQAALLLPQQPSKEVSAHIPDGQGRSLASLSPVAPYTHSLSHASSCPSCLRHTTNSYPHLLPYLGLTSKFSGRDFVWGLYVSASIAQSVS